MIKRLRVFQVTQEKNKIKIYDTEELYSIEVVIDKNIINKDTKNNIIVFEHELLNFVKKYLKNTYSLKLTGYTNTEKGFNLYTKDFNIKL